MNIFLIGFMGTGKSTISAALGKKLSKEVIEMDNVIVQREGMRISDIFEKYGEEYFREKETALIVEMQKKTSGVIVSCGGGAPMRACNVTEMKKSGPIVLLTAQPETILERVKNSHARPLLEHNKTVPYIAQLMGKRREKYEAAADVTIGTDNKSVDEICDEIVQKLYGKEG